MKNNNEPNKSNLRKVKDKLDFERLLAQLRQDQLDAALAGRIAESAFYAAEAQALRDEFAQESALCA
jgi:hypothetical protein